MIGNMRDMFLRSLSFFAGGGMVATGLLFCMVMAGGRVAAEENGPENPLRIETGKLVEFQWIAPADTDVVGYELWFFGTDSLYEIKHSFTQWMQSNSDDLSMSNLTLVLPIGHGYSKLRAFDRAGNIGGFSNRFWYDIIERDDPPGAPGFYRMRIVN